jgi:transcriptional regulator with XRE-family HTH domain
MTLFDYFLTLIVNYRIMLHILRFSSYNITGHIFLDVGGEIAMSFSSLGNEIKTLRKSRGFSQKELSEGICSQAQISRIEKGDVYPLAPTLYELSIRLGVEISYFFERALVGRIDYVEEVYYQTREAIIKHDYQKVKEIVQTEIKNPLYKNYLDFRQFIMWHQGVCEYHINYDRDNALDLIDQSFKLTHTCKYYSEREIEILNSKGVIYLLNGEYPLAITLFQKLLLEHEKLKYERDNAIKIRLYYNLAKALNKVGKLNESTNICEKGINYCVSKNNMYLFGQLYFQIGYNLYQLEEKEQARHYFLKSYTIFEFQKNTTFMEHIHKTFLS